ncbi:MAG: carboxypeptidase-like regulatory domain-containing protein [Fimbriiglobus sp.]
MTVLGNDGQPLPGAKLEWLVANNPPQALGETDAAGTFNAQVPQGSGFILAGCGELGLDYLECDEKTTEAKLKLRKDVPIRGQLKHANGKPIVGAKVRVMAITDYGDNTIQPFLNAWRERCQLAAPTKKMDMTFEGIDGWREWTQLAPTMRKFETAYEGLWSTKTNNEGQFEIHNIGGERLAHLQIEHPGIARTDVYVVTRPDFDSKPYDTYAPAIQNNYFYREFHLSGFHPLIKAPHLEICCEDERILQGVVRDAITNQPIAGIKLITAQYDRIAPPFFTVSDAQGKYQFRGLRRRGDYSVYTNCNSNRGYLNSMANVSDKDGSAPISLDIPCMKGVIVTGTVTDKTTGKPAKGHIATKVIGKNKYVEKFPFLGRLIVLSSSEVEANGSYQVVTIPGLTLLDVQATGPEEPEYRLAKPDPLYPNLFDVYPTRMHTRERIDYRSDVIGHLCKVLDVEKDNETIQHDFAFERGKAATIQLESTDKKPLLGCRVTGYHSRTHFTPLDLGNRNEFTAYNVDQTGERYVYAHDRVKKMVGLVNLTDNPKQVLTLGAGVTIQGRIVDRSNKPVAGCKIPLRFKNHIIDSIVEAENSGRVVTMTGTDGRFSFVNVLPDQQIWFEFHPNDAGGNFPYGKKPLSGKLSETHRSGQKHGEIVDVGDGIMDVENRSLLPLGIRK